MTEVLWRCRECGKWSHAKRGPIRHKRWINTGGADTDYGPVSYGHFVWCGPFDRWTANHDDPSPRGDLADLGEVAPDGGNNDSPEDAAPSKVSF